MGANHGWHRRSAMFMRKAKLEELKEKIAGGEVQYVIVELLKLDWIGMAVREEVMAISARWKHYNRGQRMNTLHFQDGEVTHSQITASLISVLSGLSHLEEERDSGSILAPIGGQMESGAVPSEGTARNRRRFLVPVTLILVIGGVLGNLMVTNLTDPVRLFGRAFRKSSATWILCNRDPVPKEVRIDPGDLGEPKENISNASTLVAGKNRVEEDTNSAKALLDSLPAETSPELAVVKGRVYDPSKSGKANKIVGIEGILVYGLTKGGRIPGCVAETKPDGTFELIVPGGTNIEKVEAVDERGHYFDRMLLKSKFCLIPLTHKK